MNKKELEKLKESIAFFKENGFSENGYIAKTVKNFLDGNSEINDDSIKLSNEYRNHLIRVLKAGIKIPQLINSTREECAKIVDKKVKYLTNQFKKGYISHSINPTLRELAREIRDKKC